MNSPDRRPKTDSIPPLTAMTVAALTMATLAGARGTATGKHILRIQHDIQALAHHLKHHPHFSAVLTEPFIQTLVQSAPLHDMGNIAIPDRILLKLTRLTAEEFEIMKTHTTMARDVIEQVEKALGCPSEPLTTLKELVFSHHEKWDGSGYPQRLAGDQIPVSARLLAIVDVYDALISDRVYKAGVPHAQAVAIIFQERASHFDPDMVDAFMEIQDEFAAISRRHADTEQDMQKKIEYMANAIAENAEL